jgi:hypothetical protein
MLRVGILNGVDPHSSEYWGDIRDGDQRIVEAADIARILWLSRSRIWAHLDVRQRQRITTRLLSAAQRKTSLNNWMLFPVLDPYS